MATAAPAKTLTFTRRIAAPMAQVYRAFTHRDYLTMWLADQAIAVPQVNSSILLHWNRGYYTMGVYTALEENSKVAFTWQGSKEAETHVAATLKEVDGAINVTLEHGGFGPEVGDEALAGFTAEWEGAMDRLKASLEYGADLRIVNRVIVGIIPGRVPDDVQEALGISAQDGTGVGRVLPGLGAEAAGLQEGDVILNIAGEDLSATNNMTIVTNKFKPGDTVDVNFYRDGEKHTLPMKLSGYPVPHIASTFEELANRTEAAYAELGAELDAIFAGVNADHASAKPAEGEWSANDTIAHLILNEQYTHIIIGMFTQNNHAQGGYSANSDPRINAMVSLHPTSADLIAAYKAAMHETVVLLRAVGPMLNEVKTALWQMSFNMDFLPQHARGHFQQMKDAIAAARGE